MQKSTREGAFLYNVELLRYAAPLLYSIVAIVKVGFAHEEVCKEVNNCKEKRNTCPEENQHQRASVAIPKV